LDVKRLIETKVLPQRLQSRFRGPLPQEKFRRVTRGYVHHQKNDDGYPQKGRNEEEYPSNDVS
jgi:hypothetical protein